MTRIPRSWSMLATAVTLCLYGAAASAGTAKEAVGAEAVVKTVVYSGATLIDGSGAPARPGMAVVVENDLIKAVLPADQASKQFAGATVRDVGKLYVLPGLIDSHVHLATPPNRKWAEAKMRRLVYSGVTAGRDMADDLRSIAELARAARVGDIPGPDLYFAAIMAGNSFFDDPRVAAVSQGGVIGKVPWAQAVDENTDLRMAVAEAKGTYATAIKIYSNLPPAMVKRIAAEAHRQGLKVWAHATVFPTRPQDVVDGGVDVISHACYIGYHLTPQVPSTYAEAVRGTVPIETAYLGQGDNPKMAELFADMKRRGTIFDATLNVFAYIEWAKEKEWAKKPGSKSKTPCTMQNNVRLTSQAFRAGIPIVAGTDYETAWQQPYPALHEELEVLSDRVGMSPSEVIRSATSIAARALGHEAEMGTIEPGKLANMVFVSRDPIQDISNLRSVAFTVKRGVVLERAKYAPITAQEAEGAED